MPAPHATSPSPLVSVVVPTLNERGNIELLFARLCEGLAELPWEMIVVDDDSSDGTWAWAKAKAQSDRRLRCLRRIDRRGLAGACIEGMLSSSAPVVAVIDADLQHDEQILSSMVRPALEGRADLVIGTRRRQVGAVRGFSRARSWLSAAGSLMAQTIMSRVVADPMSGYFVIRRDLCEALAPRLSTDGYKILFDILSKAPTVTRVIEVEYEFGRRAHGDSKLEARVLVDHVGLMVHTLSGTLIPARLVTYMLVGLVGLIVHIVIFRYVHGGWPGVGFRTVELLATYGAMAINFGLNNALTFRDRRLRGWWMVPGLIGFVIVCSIGVIANLSVSTWIFDPAQWWSAGLLGAMVSAFWNFAASSTLIWPERGGLRRTKRRKFRSSIVERTDL